MSNAAPYFNLSSRMPLSKEQEIESNYIRIDLDEAAKKCAASRYSEGFEIDENSDDFLRMYDIYYDILFKCKE